MREWIVTIVDDSLSLAEVGPFEDHDEAVGAAEALAKALAEVHGWATRTVDDCVECLDTEGEVVRLLEAENTGLPGGWA